jgi:hypothetical protein
MEVGGGKIDVNEEVDGEDGELVEIDEIRGDKVDFRRWKLMTSYRFDRGSIKPPDLIIKLNFDFGITKE